MSRPILQSLHRPCPSAGRVARRVARDFFLASLVLASIGASSMVMNLFDAGKAPLLMVLLELLNYTLAAVFIVVLPLLIHSVYKTERSRSLNLAFLTLACLTAVVAVALAAAAMTAKWRTSFTSLESDPYSCTPSSWFQSSRRRHFKPCCRSR